MQIMEALKCNAFQIPSPLLSSLSSERALCVWDESFSFGWFVCYYWQSWKLAIFPIQNHFSNQINLFIQNIDAEIELLVHLFQTKSLNLVV